MKKYFFLTIIIFTFGVPSAFAFSDVSENYIHFAALQYLSDRGIIQGYSDGTFQPEKTINRAEFVKMIVTAAGISTTDSAAAHALPFSDLAPEAWYLPYVQIAYERGIIRGYPDGSFKPDQVINLAETLKILLMSFAVSVENFTSGEVPYLDVKQSDWYFPYASYFQQKNMNDPEDDGLFHAEQSMNRGEVAEILYRFLYLREHQLDAFDITLNWPVITKKNLNVSFKIPSRWRVHDLNDLVIVWKSSAQNSQRLLSNSARVTVVLDPNEAKLSSGDYFERMRTSFSAFPQVSVPSFSWNGQYPTLRIKFQTEFEAMSDWYVYLPNGKILIFYATIGLGTARDALLEEIIALEHSFTYVENDETVSPDVLEQARKNVFIDGLGEETLALFPDRELIETDAIGIGTGPVDYYYSSSFNVTLKYERSFDVILAIQEGKTTEF